MKKVGLTLGKYAPFHKGHQYVIETALRETDEVIVIIYDATETTSIPLDKRASWIRKLYPTVEVIEGWNGPAVMGDTPEIRRIQEDYVLGLLKGRKVTHFYSSEFYGDHMSKALNAINREIDRNRSAFPVSGTSIRNNPFACREFLSPIVYRDLVTNVVFLGAPSTGKTTLAKAMAEEFSTYWMPEYGREYWENNHVNRRLSLRQLVEIAKGHIGREEKLLESADTFLFTDTNAITTFMFSMYYHNEVDPELVEMARSAEKRYDFVFVCDTDIPYDDTWDRSGDVSRINFQRQIILDLNHRKVPFHVLNGSLSERMETVKKIIKGFCKI